MPQRPWFKFFVSDWLLSDTVEDMTPEERGLYIQLLAQQWHRGGALRADDTKLQRLAAANDQQWNRSKAKVLEQFETDSNGTVFNPRLKELWDCKLQESREKSEAGKRGMQKRWSEAKAQDHPAPQPNGQSISLAPIGANEDGEHDPNAAEAAIAVCTELGKIGLDNRRIVAEAVPLVAKQYDYSNRQVAEHLIREWNTYRASNEPYKFGFRRWMEEGKWNVKTTERKTLTPSEAQALQLARFQQ